MAEKNDFKSKASRGNGMNIFIFRSLYGCLGFYLGEDEGKFGLRKEIFIHALILIDVRENQVYFPGFMSGSHFLGFTRKDMLGQRTRFDLI